MLSAASFPTMDCIMKNKGLRKILTALFVLVFWVLVWWLSSLSVNNIDILPGPSDTFIALTELFSQKSFYIAIFFTFLRVIAGLLSGIIIGTTLAFICHKFSFARSLITPVISVLKAVPVAVLIVLLLFTLRGSYLIVFIGFVMVMPIIFQNALAGLDSIDRDLIEVGEIFGFSLIKRLKLLVFPALRSYLAPAIITAVGLAYKSQVATEIIAYTKNSIGQYIYDANYGLNTEVAFAWTIVIIVFSIGLESVCRFLLGRVKNGS